MLWAYVMHITSCGGVWNTTLWSAYLGLEQLSQTTFRFRTETYMYGVILSMASRNLNLLQAI